MNRLTLTIIASAAAALVVGGPAQAADATADPGPPLRFRGAVSGVLQHIAFLDPLNPDCSSAGAAVVRVLLAPQHGALRTAQEEGFSSYPANAQQFACNLHKTAGLALLYTSDPGFAGDDQMVISLIYPGGYRYVYRFVITVEPARQLDIPREGRQQV